MGAITELNTYLRQMYSGRQLRAGLVNSWPGERFDLWPRCRRDGSAPRRFSSTFHAEIQTRAWSLFRTVNDPDDAVFFVVDTWCAMDGPMRPRTGLWVMGHFLKYRRLLTNVGYEEIPYLYADDADEAAEARTCRFCVRCRVSDIRVRPLLTAIGNQDFPQRKPRFYDDCFFVNTTRHTIFHMYDDRMADVTSADPAIWQGVVARFKDWVYPEE